MNVNLRPGVNEAVSGVEGLSSVEAARLFRKFGPNATPDPKAHPLRRLATKFIAPVPCLLEGAIVLQLFLHEYIEAGMIGMLLVFNAALGFFHEQRAEATLAALKTRLALVASARRDHGWRNIPATELVPGDVVALSLGCVVPADVRIVAGGVLLDQSMITGESLPVEAGPGFDAYAGALVRRGRAIAKVTATGGQTKSGRTAEIVRTANVVSTQQKAIFRVVRNLAMVNSAIAGGLILYAYRISIPPAEFIPLILIAILATVPVALPATFTLASALGARTLARQGVLPTRLSAVEEAASMDLLCSDKTGTLTRNALTVAAVTSRWGFTEDQVLAFAAIASSESGMDPIDQAVRAASGSTLPGQFRLRKFIPFDPETKLSEAFATGPDGTDLRIVKGAFATVAGLCEPCSDATAQAEALESKGLRVLGVAVESAGSMHLAGLISLGDPPRDDAAPLIAELRRLGVRVVVITGDAAATAEAVARQVGVTGPVCETRAFDDNSEVRKFDVFAGVLPEDKFRIVNLLQGEGHTVGMCGDGANDAPALRQAQMGIAVSTATDVAKSAAGIVLTEPGLAGIVTAVREGRVTFQRILTYTLRSIIHKVQQVLFLTVGLVITGHAILTPMLMVLSLITGDFLAMSATTDNVRPSAKPNTWRIGSLTIVGVVLGLCDLIFCTAVLVVGKYRLGLSLDALRTLTLVTLVFSGQAIFYVVRERRRIWSSWPSRIVILSSVADLLIIPSLAASGVLMAPLPIPIILATFAATIALAFMLDLVKVAVIRRLLMS